MTITIILIILIIIGAITWTLEKENVGNTAASNELKAKRTRHKLKVLRIWFWITFIFGIVLFTIIIIETFRASEPNLDFGTFLGTFIFLFTVPLFLLFCILRQKKQLQTILLTLKTTNVGQDNLFNQNSMTDDSSSEKQKNKPLSQIMKELLFCRKEEGAIKCLVNESAFCGSSYSENHWNIRRWSYDDFDYVNEGADLFVIYCVPPYSRGISFPEQIIKSPVSGYLYKMVGSQQVQWNSPTGIVCGFYDDLNLLLNNLHINEIEVVKDVFSSDIVVKGKRIVGSFDWFTLGLIKEKKTYGTNSVEITAGQIQINFENRMGEYSLLLKYARKVINIRKNDIFNLLFENGIALSLYSLSAPIKCLDNKENSVLRYGLKAEHIKNFKEYTLSKWQIKTSDGEIIGEGIIQHNKGIGLVFKDFITKFENEVQRNIPEADLLKYEQFYQQDNSKPTSECCHVYLMKDTTNLYYKIGISNKPEYREKTLQSEKPTIEMICNKVYPSRKMARAIESALHTTYSEKHIRGEWFKLDDTDVAEIIKTLS